MSSAALSRHWEDLWGDSTADRGGDDRQATAYRFGEGAAAPHNCLSGMLAQLLSAVRMHQKKHFPGAIGSDSCWAVLLQLYASHVYQRRLHIQALTERCGVPGTTVLRALDALIAAGFVNRSEDRFDRRRVIVELTDAGAAAMNDCLLNPGTTAKFF